MNFSQKLGLFILILISAVYIYFSFFNDNSNLADFKSMNEEKVSFNPFDPSIEVKKNETKKLCYWNTCVREFIDVVGVWQQR